ncbi:hypothetical protein [Comamonas antarctica]|uniref:hypothetical protein n=1 Tax=Comamonas antarctica TaxID=2743470 RepID=UPI0028E27BE6|nr:hypothetical protein [Comamonas antarctica]
MPNPQDTPETLVARAQELIDRVQRDMASTEEFYRREGLDANKVRATLEDSLTVAQRLQAQQAFQADMEAVEQEVREEAARQSFGRQTPATGAVRRRRQMI